MPAKLLYRFTEFPIDDELNLNDISGTDFMMHPFLEADVSHLGPLINSAAEDLLLRKYVEL